jgi:quinohemoprotein amine dehydrogenase
MRLGLAAPSALLVGVCASLLAQRAPAPRADGTEEGIPIASQAVKSACMTCHAADSKSRLTRISYRRTTPEGWEETIKRMATLNGASFEPALAREALRDLSNDLGLAPEEVQPARFELERRLVEYSYPDKDTQRTCSLCHSIGRAMLQRRTKEEWDLLVAMHRGYYPLVDFQGFRYPEPPPDTPGPDGRPSDRRQPVEKALDHLKGAFPLQTPEWSAWSANRRAPRLAGRWALSAYEIGRGSHFGEVEIAAQPDAEDQFTTVARYAPAGGGAAVERHGRAIVYTGFQWRGRSSAGDETLREVMLLESDGRRMTGRWFTGAYDERGLDVTLTRIGTEPVVVGVTPRALRAGAHASVRIYGANLGSVGAVDFGRGVRVSQLARDDAGLRAELDVSPDAPIGERDLFVDGVSSPHAAVVFKTIDSLKVTPPAGLARIGGARFPKRFEQFEARAWSNGVDGKPDTKDDLDLGRVDVGWSLEEFTATLGDDDTRWVGRIDERGLFTPAEDGPNPKRQGDRNNVGDVWVVANLPDTSPSKPKAMLRARAHLVVSVPLYVRWDQPEVLP